MTEYEHGRTYSCGDKYLMFVAYHPFHPVCICLDMYGELTTTGLCDLQPLYEEM